MTRFAPPHPTTEFPMNMGRAPRLRIAVVGSGISGLGAALRLTDRGHWVTLYEADDRLGGHSNAVDVNLEGITHPVDTGFLVFNERTYPRLLALFAELGVRTAVSDMSFSVSAGPHDFEWCGSSLRSLFAQPSNALSPRFWRMLRDIARFNREATALALQPQGGSASERLDRTLGEHLREAGYSAGFRDDYLLPMAAAIWSCPLQTMLQFPLGSFVRFFHNHGLLQLRDRPQWFTVQASSRQYVQAVAARLRDVRLGTPVLQIRRSATGHPDRIQLSTASAVESFDHVVLACHSDQALQLLADPSDDEFDLLGRIRYQPNTAWLHTDTRLMPRRRSAWAAWNYLSDRRPGAPQVSVTYWLNRLQPLPFQTPVMVSLNPIAEPARDHVITRLDYEHPVLDAAAVQAQRQLARIQGLRNTWFAGAWTAYGFHEDGLRSGEAVAQGIDEAAQREASEPVAA
jgi:predicted NAD/FAD-binding protein